MASRWNQPKNVRQQLNEGERLLRQAELPAAVKAYHRAWSDTSLIEEEFVLTILTGVQREWPAIVAELRGTLHERLEPLDDARMRFEFAMASVAIQMQALANLLPVDQAQAHPPACVDVSPNAQRRSR